MKIHHDKIIVNVFFIPVHNNTNYCPIPTAESIAEETTHTSEHTHSMCDKHFAGICFPEGQKPAAWPFTSELEFTRWIDTENR